MRSLVVIVLVVANIVSACSYVPRMLPSGDEATVEDALVIIDEHCSDIKNRQNEMIRDTTGVLVEQYRGHDWVENYTKISMGKIYEKSIDIRSKFIKQSAIVNQKSSIRTQKILKKLDEKILQTGRTTRQFKRSRSLDDFGRVCESTRNLLLVLGDLVRSAKRDGLYPG